jgi:enamine deaminase RidA (YjgF/YER057c/UK114 family)
MERVPAGRIWGETVGYSRAVRVGNLIEVAGTAAAGPDGEIVAPGDMYGQARYCLQAIREAIEALGGRVEHVVRTRVYLTDVTRWEEAGRAHGEVFGEIQPASAFLGVSELIVPGLLIEIEATAVVV